MQFKPAFPKFVAITLTALLSLTALSAAAEDGTSGTLPESFHQCEIVEASWSEPAPTSEVSPVASPVASPIASPVASPMASPAASPIASPVVVEEELPVAEDSALTDDLEAATHAILDCMSDNNAEVLTQITGKQFRASWLGMGTSMSDADFAALLPLMPNLPYALVDIDGATAEGDSATATVKFTAGRQLMTAEWSYQLIEIDGNDVWQVQQETHLPTEIPADASTMQLTVDDGSYSFAESTVASGDIVINIENVGEQPHEVLIVRVPGGTSAADFAAAPSGIPSGGTFIGQVTVPSGSDGNIVLTNVRSGTYTVVDLLPGETGLPNVSNGMITEFTVE